MVAVVVAADSHQGAAASCYYQPSCGIMLLLVAAALFFGLPVVSALVASRRGPQIFQGWVAVTTHHVTALVLCVKSENTDNNSYQATLIPV